MQRSKSSSRLPVKADFFGKERRSASMDRRITGSVDRKSKTRSLSLKPLSTPQYKAQRSRSRSPFDNRNSDKKNLSQQFEKVSQYILLNMPKNEEIISNLKPLSIRAFVETVNFLLSKIDFRIQICMENYQVTVISKLKTIKCPCPLSPSLIKTVNTMHSWPQIIGIFSWLIDLINVIYAEEDDQLLLMLMDFINSTYLSINNQQDSSCLTVNTTYLEQLEKYFKIDKAALEFAENELQKVKIQKDKMDKKLKKLEIQIQEFEDNNKDSKEIEKYYVQRTQTEEDFLKKIKQLEEEERFLTESYNAKISKKNDLDAIVSTQSCSLQKRDELFKQVQQIKESLEEKKQHKQDYEGRRDELELKFTQIKTKIKTEVSRINRELIPHTLVKPELKDFALTTCRFFDFNEKLEKFLETKNLFETKLNKELNELKTSVNTLEMDKALILKRHSEFEKNVYDLQRKSNEFEKSIMAMKEHLTQILNSIENELKIILEENVIKYSSKINDIPAVEKAFILIQEVYMEKKSELKMMQENSVRLFGELHKIMKQKAQALLEFQNLYATTINTNLKKIHEFHQNLNLKEYEEKYCKK